ncbi:MAG: ABC transporter permease [Patescibacteria group bacterium]|nr:ABC transporter permease [Patescibacteria group bacterium]
MSSFYQLFLANFKMFFREKEGFYWTVLMPAFIYVALSMLPISAGLAGQIKYSNFVLPGIIAMTIMQGGIYSLAYWMVDLKSRGIIKRLMATPIKQWQLALSLVCARLTIVIGQVIILTLLGTLVFKASFTGSLMNLLSILVLILEGGAIFLMIGLLISNFAKSYDAAAPLTSAVGLPLTFLGNIFYPISALPHGLQVFARLLPITYLADGLRQAYLHPFAAAIIGWDIFYLTLWLIAVLALTLWLFRLKE